MKTSTDEAPPPRRRIVQNTLFSLVSKVQGALFKLLNNADPVARAVRRKLWTVFGAICGGDLQSCFIGKIRYSERFNQVCPRVLLSFGLSGYRPNFFMLRILFNR